MGFVEAVHGHIQGLARYYETQIDTNIGLQLSVTSPAISSAVRYAGLVLTSFIQWDPTEERNSNIKEDTRDATQAKQEGIQGQWQHESLFKVEQVKRSADTDCNAQMMRRAYNAKQLDNWESFKEEYRKEGQLCEWTIERLQEAYD